MMALEWTLDAIFVNIFNGFGHLKNINEFQIQNQIVTASAAVWAWQRTANNVKSLMR